MELIMNDSRFVQRKGPGNCFIAIVSSPATTLAKGKGFHMTLDIQGNLVTALLDTDLERSHSELYIGAKLLVEGWWKSEAWKSTLVIRKCSLQSMPKSHAVAETHLSQQEQLLEQLIAQLRQPLRDFVTEVLDGEVGHRFKSLPASMHHHHHQREGLLTHSLECALMAGQMALTWLNRTEAELTMVAALFHDLGKCGTYRTTGTHADLGNYVTHESHTIELLAPYLTQLESHWRIGANMLRHMLSQERASQKFPAFPGTLLVKMADHFSTALDMRRTLFQGKPGYHHFAYDQATGQRYLRVPG